MGRLFKRKNPLFRERKQESQQKSSEVEVRPQCRVGMLVDVENVGMDRFVETLTIAKQYGYVTERIVYGNMKAMTRSDELLMMRHRLKMRHCAYTNNKGKNTADMYLTVAAMELLEQNQVDVFVIVSSDADFIPIALRVRNRGKKVIGIGGAKASTYYQESCSEFHLLEEEPSVKAPAEINAGVRQYKGENIGEFIEATIAAAPAPAKDKNGWRLLSHVAEELKGRGVKCKDFGCKQFSELVLKYVDGVEFSDKKKKVRLREMAIGMTKDQVGDVFADAIEGSRISRDGGWREMGTIASMIDDNRVPFKKLGFKKFSDALRYYQKLIGIEVSGDKVRFRNETDLLAEPKPVVEEKWIVDNDAEVERILISICEEEIPRFGGWLPMNVLMKQARSQWVYWKKLGFESASDFVLSFPGVFEMNERKTEVRFVKVVESTESTEVLDFEVDDLIILLDVLESASNEKEWVEQNEFWALLQEDSRWDYSKYKVNFMRRLRNVHQIEWSAEASNHKQKIRLLRNFKESNADETASCAKVVDELADIVGPAPITYSEKKLKDDDVVCDEDSYSEQYFDW